MLVLVTMVTSIAFHLGYSLEQLREVEYIVITLNTESVEGESVLVTCYTVMVIVSNPPPLPLSPSLLLQLQLDLIQSVNTL